MSRKKTIYIGFKEKNEKKHMEKLLYLCIRTRDLG